MPLVDYADVQLVELLRSLLREHAGTHNARALAPGVISKTKLYDFEGTWPAEAETMIGRNRLENFVECVARAVFKKIDGDIIETGVWRGGACIAARGVLRTLGDTARKVWVADSFQGLPEPNVERYPIDEGDKHSTMSTLAISLDEVKSNFKHYGLLDDQVEFLVGWFEETLFTAPIDKLAVLRLDGDMYSSTIQALDALYSKLSCGGYCIIDDYALKGCYTAVNDYRAANNITDPIREIDWTGIWWEKQTQVVKGEQTSRHRSSIIPTSTEYKALP